MTRLDLLGVCLGFVTFESGVALWSVPASLVAGGVLLMVAALWPARKAAR